jgi:hypothetical protein
MKSDNIILRIVTVAGLTTKGAQLTAEELDENFIAIWQDLKQRLSAGALAAYDGLTSYVIGEAVTYDDKTWLALDASTGTTPGSDEDIWSEIPVEYLAHQKDRDEALAKGTADEVTAAEIRAFIDGGGAGANFFNTDLLADADRAHDADGFGVSVANLSHWWSDASDFAPSLGRASHEWWGYGSGGSDVLTRVRNGAGTLAHEILGDTSQIAYGPMYFQTTTQGIDKSSSANAVRIFKSGAGDWNFGWNYNELRAFGTFASDSIEINNDNSESYFTQIDSTTGRKWKFGHKAGDGSIAGKIGGGLVDTEIVSIDKNDGMFKLSLGLFKLTGIPTSSAGLASGTVWNDSGTLKIS